MFIILKYDMNIFKIIIFQKSIVDWDIAGMTQLKNYGHLIFDGEIRIKVHNEQKFKQR